ncbi:uncharacterized protein LOC142825558 isoform X4 [Pelodiscus sinensis]|uniref:uncharacterized protein LOC142825558 isoform X4 n=1 Tax=Pelodiscus sinensis TaxID=13735 RepID=UPI003F6D352F
MASVTSLPELLVFEHTPTLGPPNSLLLPLPAIVFITVAAYLLLLLLLLALRQCLLSRGLCADCCWCEKGVLGAPCQCCVSCTEACDCAPSSLTRCLETCWPRCQVSDPSPFGELTPMLSWLGACCLPLCSSLLSPL